MKFKKYAAVFLAALTVLCVFGACGKNAGDSPKKVEVKLPDKKIAVLVAPAEEYPEDYAAAQELAEAYPETVIVKEYPDSRKLVAGDSQIIKLSAELAEDVNVGAIIYARATEFTNYAIARAKNINPQIVTVALEPEDKLSSVAGAASLVFACNWQAAANDMIQALKTAGTEDFVYLSFDRHLGNELIEEQKSFFKAACSENDVNFVEDKCFDPTRAEGFNKAQLVIKEKFAALEMNNKIKPGKSAFFCTDSSVQKLIAELAAEKGYIYVSPNFPSVFGGAAEKYGLKPDASNYKAADFAKQLSAAVKADKENKGIFGFYGKNLMRSLLFGAFYCTTDILNGGAGGTESMVNHLGEALGSSAAAGIYGAYDNVFTAYEKGFEIIK